MSKSIEYCKKKKLEISIKKNRVEKNKITEKTVEICKKCDEKFLQSESLHSIMKKYE